MSGIRTTTLKNGLRIVTDSVESMYSAALGIWTGVGTRHEDPAENGVAHMVEHMLFKGTEKRGPLQIAEEIEAVGGSMNAYTSREITSYHVHLLKDDINLGTEVLCDMYLNATLPQHEIEREREVILQEIGMSNDTPDDLVFDHYFETAYPGQSMGAPILGREANVENMTHAMLAGHINKFYTPARTVLSAAGAIDHDEFVDSVAALMNTLPQDNLSAPVPASYKGGEIRTERALEQAHVILGFQGLDRFDPDYYTVQALSTILGGGMSSRLFHEIREKRGLVYSIFSFHAGHQDDGLFGVYAGTGPDKLTEIMPVICDELLKSGDDVREEELARAKAQLKASALMGRESMMTRADQHAKHMLYRDKVFNLEDQIARIDAVDLAGIARVSKRVFSSEPTLAALGPVKSLEPFDTIKNRMGQARA
ncbi:MAG: insulinase family protein [Alphaproteobacteria bacterium]|nr:insulinase family protein [Alphaproteobacteria bacterium]